MRTNATSNAIKIAICNQKGGCGKTTSCFNIAGMLSKNHKKKVLIVDVDPQGSITKAILTENISEYENSSHNGSWFENHITLDNVIEELSVEKDLVNRAVVKADIQIRDKNPARWRGIDVLPGGRNLAVTKPREDQDMDEIISHIRRTVKRPYNYDYVLFDLPPALSDMSAVTLMACDYILIPVTPDAGAIDGIAELMQTVENIKANSYNKKLEIAGIFFTNFDSRYKYDRDLYDMAKQVLGNRLMKTYIRRGPEAKQSMQIGCPLAWYKRTSYPAKDYMEITKELIERTGKRN